MSVKSIICHVPCRRPSILPSPFWIPIPIAVERQLPDITHMKLFLRSSSLQVASWRSSHAPPFTSKLILTINRTVQLIPFFVLVGKYSVQFRHVIETPIQNILDIDVSVGFCFTVTIYEQCIYAVSVYTAYTSIIRPITMAV